ncbi:MAG: hypothetical protein IT377_15280 [Polyangiaceae bacterium]|nr:hypothetical protein [Polyangiaceae bacterium]
MLKTWWWLALLPVACGSPSPPPSVASTPPPPPSAPPSAAPPTPAPPPRASAVPVPPLASPNPTAPSTADGGTAPQPQSPDPLRRIGQAAQACHAQHASGIKGRLTLGIARDSSGKVTRVGILRPRSSAELAKVAFETCVIDAVTKERLSPPRGEDDELELPLIFEPTP